MRGASGAQAHSDGTAGIKQVPLMRQGRRSLSGPLTRLPCRPPAYSPTLRRETSRRSRGRLTAAHDMSSRSIRSSRRRASRERWSSSNRNKLRLQKSILGMAPSIAGTLSATSRSGAAQIVRRSPSKCELLHIGGALCWSRRTRSAPRRHSRDRPMSQHGMAKEPRRMSRRETTAVHPQPR